MVILALILSSWHRLIRCLCCFHLLFHGGTFFLKILGSCCPRLSRARVRARIRARIGLRLSSFFVVDEAEYIENRLEEVVGGVEKEEICRSH